MNILVSKQLEPLVREYRDQRRYETDTRAANELIRIALEKEGKLRPIPTS